MKFTKMHGVGNDYIYVNCMEQELKNPEELALKLSDRHFGIGADGLVLICKSNVATAKMRMFNADGSEGKMCGNAIRCVGKYIYDKGIYKEKNMTIETLSGIKNLELDIINDKVELISVDMGKASFLAKDADINTKKEIFDRETIKILSEEYEVTSVSMGNPHIVTFVDNTQILDLEKIGPLFEKNTLFLRGINTEFVEVIGKNHVKMRVYERGSGETLACGTGACAVACVCVKQGIFKANEEILIEVLGGKLFVEVSGDFNVMLKGEAKEVFSGEIKTDC